MSTPKIVAEPIHVSMAVDRGFEVPLAVSLLSLAEVHDDRDVRCKVSVLCAGLDVRIRSRIERDLAQRVDIEWVEVDPARVEGASYTAGLSSAALFRILLPDLLPASQSRTIYLDADTLVRQPLTALWRTDLEHNLLAAVRDAGSPHAAGAVCTDWRSLGLAADAPYFNSGLMVLHLDQWRKDATADATLTLLRERRLPWGDQDALNLVAQGRWLELPRQWNLQTPDALEKSLSWVLWRSDVEAAMAHPAVVHFTDNAKPWLGKVDHPFADQWFATLERSSWAGWNHYGNTKLARAVGRLSRAARVLRYG